MHSKEDILRFLADNKEFFKKAFGIIRIGLFGSYSRGDQTKLSDIDLVVEFEPGTENLFEKKLELKKFISDELGVTTDICREKYIKKRIRSNIIRETEYAY
ncbi:MAG: nucleotidyltransferase domain-containing protein [Bacteroidales bacterium]|nr:nucleotidyltransferase domain-containing protein [Bacteroidales bacterium]